MNTQRIRRFRDQYRAALLDDVVPFWERHSVDRECGGFFLCLGRDGTVYGTDKPVWMEGRAVWFYATLHRLVEPRANWLDLARHGYDFLTKYCFAPPAGAASPATGPAGPAVMGGAGAAAAKPRAATGTPAARPVPKMYFLVDRRGRPLRMRRYVYSEVFGTLAAAALAQAADDAAARQLAIDLYASFVRHVRTPGLLEPKVDPATRPMKGLAPRMCLLNLADTLLAIDPSEEYERHIDETIEEIFRDFVKPDRRCVLEAVGPGGEFLDEPDGRVMNPGHAIEAAWFILEVARRRGDAALARRAGPILDVSFERGWDPEHGGLLYFVDVAGKPATQLEHDMKLWWPHCEALYATLLAYRLTGEEKYARMFEQVHEYAFARFPDSQYGEWFGYLHRDGTLSTPLKGGMWKGPFHVPRALLYCWKLLEEMG